MAALRGLRRLPTWGFWLPLAALLLLACLEAFGPHGFAGRDEMLALEDLARRAGGGPPAPTWGNGFWLKHAQAFFVGFTHDWRGAHLPVLLGLPLQAVALGLAGYRLGGRAVAQGAVLCALLSATALLQARSLLPFSVLPALLAGSLALLLQSGWAAFFGGLLLASGLMEYEATLFALPGFAALCFFEPRLRARAKTFFLAGFALGLAGVLLYCRRDLADWLTYRLAYNHPQKTMAAGRALGQLRDWLWGGQPDAYLGVWKHPATAWWSLPFIAAGLWLQRQRRPWLWVWLLAGLATLLPASGAFEPNRTVAALPALALAGGFGWRWAWARARLHGPLAWLLVLLPLAGLAIEQRAFDRSMLRGQPGYGRSQGWLAAGRDPRFAGRTDAMLLPSGLAIESIVGPLQGAPAWVWLPGDLGEDAPAWPGVALLDRAGQLTGDTLAQVPGPDPLLQDLARLRPFWLRLPASRPGIAQACREALQSRLVTTKVAQAALWMELMKAAIPANTLTQEDLDGLDRGDFHSFRLYRALYGTALPKDLRLSDCLLWQLRKHGGAQRLSADESALLAVPWDRLPVTAGSPVWRAPR